MSRLKIMPLTDPERPTKDAANTSARSMTPEQRALLSAKTKAWMASPEVRAKISERTKEGMLAAIGQLQELRLLRQAWLSAGPRARKRFLDEILTACLALRPNVEGSQ